MGEKDSFREYERWTKWIQRFFWKMAPMSLKCWNLDWLEIHTA